MWGGIALGADIALFFSAVKLTSVVNATIIGAMQPIVVGVVAATFFGEKIGLRNVMWSLVALIGTMLVVAASAGDDANDWLGDLLALAAMLSWSAYFITSKNSKKNMTPTEFTAGTALWTIAICAPLGSRLRSGHVMAVAVELGSAHPDGGQLGSHRPRHDELVAGAHPAVGRLHVHAADSGVLGDHGVGLPRRGGVGRARPRRWPS